MGYRVAPDSDELFSELKITTCPIADANRLASLMDAYTSHKKGLFDLSKVYPTPTIAVIEAFGIMELHHQLLENRLHKRRLEEINNGN